MHHDQTRAPNSDFMTIKARLYVGAYILFALLVGSLQCGPLLAQDSTDFLSPEPTGPENQSWTIPCDPRVKTENGTPVFVPIDPNTLLSDRLPSPRPPVEMPAKCLKSVDNMRESWVDEDRANVSKIANQLCSHLAGWVEKVPGTCQAGGPPPICPVDHWQRDPNAMTKWSIEQGQIQKEREEAYKKGFCSCLVSIAGGEADETTDSPNLTASQISCGGCPDGKICLDGKCLPGPGTLIPFAVGGAATRAVGSVIAAAIPELRASIGPATGVVIGLFSSLPVDDDRSAYESAINVISKLSEQLGELQTDIAGDVSKTDKAKHGTKYYNSQLSDLKDKMQRALVKARDRYQTIKIEHQYREYDCPELLDLTDQRLSAFGQAMNGLTISSLDSNNELPEYGLDDGDLKSNK